MTEDLIELIDTLVPKLRIKPTTSLEAVMFQAGQQDMADRLKEWWEFTKKNSDPLYRTLKEVSK